MWPFRHVDDLAHVNIIFCALVGPVFHGRLGNERLARRWSLRGVGQLRGDSDMTTVRMSSEPAILTTKLDCDADVDRTYSQNDAKAPAVCKPIAECESIPFDPAPVTTDGPKSLQA